MSEKTTGVERHARQVQQGEQKSGGIRNALPDFSKKTWILIGLVVAMIILVLWWRSKGDDSSGGEENGDDGDEGGGSADLEVEDKDITEIEVDDDPLAKDRAVKEKMQEAGMAETGE